MVLPIVRQPGIKNPSLLKMAKVLSIDLSGTRRG
jgi:hypothetical protein